MTEEEKTSSQEPQPHVEESNWQDKYLRSLAEMENMRKRMQKERQETTQFGIENAISEFLPAIDNFENALRFAEGSSSEVKNWAIGFEMILAQFKQVLQSHGIVSFHSEGHKFDPTLHEAVETVETDAHPDGIILHEFTKGYKSAHRTLRPARVKVAKKGHKNNFTAPIAEEKTES